VVAELLGQRDAAVEQFSRSARVADHEVGLTLVKLQQIDTETVAGPLGDPSRLFAIGDRLGAGALVAIGHRAVVVGGGLRERVPQRLGEAQTMVGVRQGPDEIAESGKGDARVPGGGGFLGGVPERPHLLDAPGQQLAGASVFAHQVVAPSHEIHRGSGQALVTEPVGDVEAPRGIVRGGLEFTANVGEAPQPVEHPRQARVVPQPLRECLHLLQVVEVLRLGSRVVLTLARLMLASISARCRSGDAVSARVKASAWS
jgi:hypothetical protein